MSRIEIGLLDYGSGNLHSVAKALEAAGGVARLVSGPADAAGTAGLLLPGVGNFGRCARDLELAELTGLVRSWIESGRPFLGICVGMQLLYENSEESDVSGLGILRGSVKKIAGDVRVPHIGWDEVTVESPRAMYAGIDERERYYFVHSYAAELGAARGEMPLDTDTSEGVCDYGMVFAASVERGNLWATQFHPEKSGKSGIRLLSNFIRLAGSS